ncbi:hypothetical protein PsorP6_017300 [Peronosclerospora sorghi]|uniref:Uncharacterized protein n=1 Tax=Peronosclerospora sorghi TaxID=230839 RepID=A0ACC0WNX9_9STRA|nr:hypothetical protein PsorP6_017300 [Peronosclerospora sorghi]
MMNHASSSRPVASSPLSTRQNGTWRRNVAPSHATESDDDEPAPMNNEGEHEESAESDLEAEDCTPGRRRRRRIHFEVKQLQAVYHLPLKTVSPITSESAIAAERLGICEAALKRICRRNHIHKWPYRQLSSVRRRITELHDRRVELIAGRGGMDAISLQNAL